MGDRLRITWSHQPECLGCGRTQGDRATPCRHVATGLPKGSTDRVHIEKRASLLRAGTGEGGSHNGAMAMQQLSSDPLRTPPGRYCSRSPATRRSPPRARIRSISSLVLTARDPTPRTFSRSKTFMKEAVPMVTPDEIVRGLVVRFNPDVLTRNGAVVDGSWLRAVEGVHYFVCISRVRGLSTWVPSFSRQTSGRIQLRYKAGEPAWTTSDSFIELSQLWFVPDRAIGPGSCGPERTRRGQRNHASLYFLLGGARSTASLTGSRTRGTHRRRPPSHPGTGSWRAKRHLRAAWSRSVRVSLGSSRSETTRRSQCLPLRQSVGRVLEKDRVSADRRGI